MDDPFVGTWTLNPTRSAFDANHKPAAAAMTWELDADGTYLLLAEGVDAKGERCREKPQRLWPDGVAYPVEGLPGLTSVTTRPNPHTIRAEAKREDSSLAGEGTYRQIFMDGRALETAPNPSWMGYSVGRWEGETLVVDSFGFNDRTWLNDRGLPHTEPLRMTERYQGWAWAICGSM